VNGCLAMDDQKTEEEWYKHAQEEAQWGHPTVVGSSLVDPLMSNSLWMTLARSTDSPALT
jgi:hypothetical protein